MYNSKFDQESPENQLSGAWQVCNVDFYDIDNMNSPSKTQYKVQICFCHKVSDAKPII